MRRPLCTLTVALSALLASERAPAQQSAAPATPVSAPTAPAAPAERGTVAIHIRAADYAHTGTVTSCSVTAAVRQICEGKQRCVVDVGDQLCPPPGELPKGLIFTLSVRYSCQAIGPARFGAADKPFQLTITCEPNG